MLGTRSRQASPFTSLIEVLQLVEPERSPQSIWRHQIHSGNGRAIRFEAYQIRNTGRTNTTTQHEAE